jgi:hypothetical protein
LSQVFCTTPIPKALKVLKRAGVGKPPRKGDIPKIYWEPSDPPSQAGYDFVQVGEPLNGIGQGLLVDLGILRPDAVAD